MANRFTRNDFLVALFANYYRSRRGFILVRASKPGDQTESVRYFPNVDILAREDYGDHRQAFFGICPRERMRQEVQHIGYVTALWAHVDIGHRGHEDRPGYLETPQQAGQAIRKFPQPPSIIVESGRGAHLYWVLRDVVEVTDRDRIERILANIAKRFLPPRSSLPRVSLDTCHRLPETVNRSIAHAPVRCEVKFINKSFRYAIEDFEHLTRLVVVRPNAPSPVQADAKSSASDTGLEPDRGDNSPGAEDFPKNKAAERTEEARQGAPPPDSLMLDEATIDELVHNITIHTNLAETPPAHEQAPALPAADGSFAARLEKAVQDFSTPAPIGGEQGDAAAGAARFPISILSGGTRQLLIPRDTPLPAGASLSFRSMVTSGELDHRVDLLQGTCRVRSVILPALDLIGNPGGAFSIAVNHLREALEVEIASAESHWRMSFQVPLLRWEQVACAVLAPHSAQRGHSFSIHVPVYIPRAVGRAETRGGGERIGRSGGVHRILSAPAARGSALTLDLRMEGLKVNEPVQEIIWQGEAKVAHFTAIVPQDAATGRATGVVTLAQERVPVGRLRFQVNVVDGLTVEQTNLVPTGEALPFDTYYLCYAGQDRRDVTRRAHMLRLAGKRFRNELLTMNPEERWNQKLYQSIDESDAMVLFWSDRAATSQGVINECRYAIERKGVERIVPVLLRGPTHGERCKEIPELPLSGVPDYLPG